MQDLRPARFLIGGLAAGLLIVAGEYILNGILLASQWASLRREMGFAELDATRLAAGGVLTLAYGIILVWLYIVMRPNFASEIIAALVAGVTFWFIAYVLFLLSVWTSGFVTMHIALVSIAWGIIEAPVAALVGAKIYSAGRLSQA